MNYWKYLLFLSLRCLFLLFRQLVNLEFLPNFLETVGVIFLDHHFPPFWSITISHQPLGVLPQLSPPLMFGKKQLTSQWHSKSEIVPLDLSRSFVGLRFLQNLENLHATLYTCGFLWMHAQKQLKMTIDILVPRFHFPQLFSTSFCCQLGWSSLITSSLKVRWLAWPGHMGFPASYQEMIWRKNEKN